MAGNCIKANTEICLRAPNAQNDKTNGSSVTQITCSLYRSRASNVDYRTFQTDASQSECVRYPRAGLHRGVATGWTGVDMSTLLLPEVVPVIDANPVSFYSGEGGVGVGHGLQLDSPFASVRSVQSDHLGINLQIWTTV